MSIYETNIIRHFGTEFVKVSDLNIGDTIVYNSSLRTVGKNDFKYNDFMGARLFGDGSIKTIEKVKFHAYN